VPSCPLRASREISLGRSESGGQGGCALAAGGGRLGRGGDNRVVLVPPSTEYARVGDASIAYQVLGDGPVDLVFVRGVFSHVELAWDEPATARGLRRLASFSRLVVFDRRGTGLSDPVEGPSALENQIDDVRAVMRAAGLRRAALLGGHDVGLCALFAATFPDEVTALVLSGATPAARSFRHTRARSYSRRSSSVIGAAGTCCRLSRRARSVTVRSCSGTPGTSVRR